MQYFSKVKIKISAKKFIMNKVGTVAKEGRKIWGSKKGLWVGDNQSTKVVVRPHLLMAQHQAFPKPTCRAHS